MYQLRVPNKNGRQSIISDFVPRLYFLAPVIVRQWKKPIPKPPFIDGKCLIEQM
jgi:hypothetical protein